MKSGHGEKGKWGMYEEEKEAFPLGWGHHQDHMLSVINQVPCAPWWPSSKMRMKRINALKCWGLPRSWHSIKVHGYSLCSEAPELSSSWLGPATTA